MLMGVKERVRPIEVFSPFGNVPGHREGTANPPMAERDRKRLRLLMRQRKELSGKVARRMTVKCCKLRYPDALKDRKQCQRVIGWLPERLCSLD